MQVCPLRPRDRRAGRAAGHAPRRAGLSQALLPFLAVVGAAITTGITTTLRLPLGKPRGLPWCYGTLTATTPHTANASRTHGPKGRNGGGAGDCPPTATSLRPCFERTAQDKRRLISVKTSKVSRFSVWGQLWQRQHAKFSKTSQFAMNYVHLPGRFSTHVPLLGLSSDNRETFENISYFPSVISGFGVAD